MISQEVKTLTKREFLIIRRKERGLSGRRVAKLCNLNPGSYCNIENGHREPSVDTAKRIAKVLELDWTKFFEEKE